MLVHVWFQVGCRRITVTDDVSRVDVDEETWAAADVEVEVREDEDDGQAVDTVTSHALSSGSMYVVNVRIHVRCCRITPGSGCRSFSLASRSSLVEWWPAPPLLLLRPLQEAMPREEE